MMTEMEAEAVVGVGAGAVAVVVEAHMMEIGIVVIPPMDRSGAQMTEMVEAGMVVILLTDRSGTRITEIAGTVPSGVQTLTIIKMVIIVVGEAFLVLKSIMLQVRKLFLVDGVQVGLVVVVVEAEVEAKVALEACAYLVVMPAKILGGVQVQFQVPRATPWDCRTAGVEEVGGR